MGGSLDAPEWPSARSLSTALPGRMHLAERLLQSSSSRTDSSSRWSPLRPQSASGIPRDRVRTSRIHPETEPRLQLLPCPAVPPPSCGPARTLGKSQNAYPIERGVMSAKALPFGPLRNLSATLDALARHSSRPFARLQQARKPASGKRSIVNAWQR